MDFRALVEQIVQLAKKLNRKQQITIIATLVVVIALISFLIVYNAPKSKDDNFRVLFDNLTPQDAGLVIQQLDKEEIEYKIPEEGTIEVKKEIVEKTRMAIAAQGLLKDSNVGFELFDQQEFGATDFDQKVKFLRALEGELSRTVESLAAVKSARVHIALPKESVFVSKEVPPTASVVLTLHESMKLNRRQILGVKHLVSSAVSKLTLENVKIVDEEGMPLGEEDELSTAGEAARMQMRYKRDYEKIYEDKIIAMLAPFMGGTEKVVAKVTIDFDFSRRDSVREHYDPNNVVRSEQTMEEKREGYKPKEIGGVPGAVSNIGPVQGLEDNRMREKYSKAETTTNYEITKTVSNIKGEFATINRITAAVVVDGTYVPKRDENGNEVPGQMEYVPLDETQLASIENLVKQAVGFNPVRNDEVTVSNLEFQPPYGPGGAKLTPAMAMLKQLEMYLGPMYPVLKYLLIGIILFIFYKKVIAPFAQKMLEIPVEEEEQEEIRIEFGEDELEDEDDKLAELKKKVEAQLGVGDGADEEALKYDVMLERLRNMCEEKTEEIAHLLETLVSDETAKSKGGL